MRKNWKSAFGALAALVAAASISGGCVTETTTQSFRVVDNGNVESSYIATDADFGKYKALLGKDMGIYYPSGVPLTPEDIHRIRQIFRSAFLSELKDYTIVTTPGPDVLSVEASLIDMRSGTYSAVPNMRSDLGDIGKPGELVFLMELKDSTSNYVLGRAADSAKAPSIATGDGRATDWPAIEDAAKHWSALFRQFLDQNLNQ